MTDQLPSSTASLPPVSRSGALGGAQEFLKQIVYGGNDGIVTTFAIVAGFAGATAQGVAEIGTLAVLVFGLANLFADAVSMGMGEFLSARSQRGLYAMRRQGWTARLRQNTPHTLRDLTPYLTARGLTDEDHQTISDLLGRHPDLAADIAMARVYGMDDPESANLGLRALMTFFAFVTFGVIPILPYILPMSPDLRLGASVIATVIALALLGLLRWYATQERLARCLSETIIIGGLCAMVAFLVGAIVG